jgi:hypothetical protein
MKPFTMMASVVGALMSMPTKSLNHGSFAAWSRGEGFGSRQPRAPKHQRTGVYMQSERRKARRRAQLRRAGVSA